MMLSLMCRYARPRWAETGVRAAAEHLAAEVRPLAAQQGAAEIWADMTRAANEMEADLDAGADIALLLARRAADEYGGYCCEIGALADDPEHCSQEGALLV